MTIEVFGHVKEMRSGGRNGNGGVVVTIQLEMSRANGQLLDVDLSPEEAKMYMPGKGITLRFWPDGRKPSPPDFYDSADTRETDEHQS